ncbi:MAG: M13 family metallopeptidase [Hyphomicrobiales bacterium]
MNLRGKVAIFGVAAFLLSGCMAKKGDVQEDKQVVGKVVPAINLANMDNNVDPGKDFYRYVSGNWIKNNPLPDDKSVFGAFTVISESNKKNLKALIEEVSNDENATKGTINQKIRDFYNSGMDSASINALGYEPLKPYFAEIDGIKDVPSLLDVMAKIQLRGNSPSFYLWVGQDAKASDVNRLHIYSAGLTLSNKDYYLNDDSRSEEIREKLREYMTAMHKLVGQDETTAKKNTETIIGIETKMADKEYSSLERRDPNLRYNKYSYEDLKKDFPNFDWDTYFSNLGIETDQVIISNPKFLSLINDFIVDIPVEDWKTYLKWHLLDGAAGSLSDEFGQANFDFYGKFLSGTPERSPRWKRILGATNSVLGEAIGQLYVQRHFPPEAKERMLELVENLKLSFSDRIDQLEWMSDATKEKAHEKLNSIVVKVGYPDKWKDYSGLDVVPDSYYTNNVVSGIFEYKDNLEDLKKPVDRSKWGMYPQEVNAYYHPLMNEVVFPAGILQPPFFNINADDPVNYGAIGVVIGHEMTHGFDDKGRLFDAKGNLSVWWTDEDAQKFEKRAQVLVNQFNNYIVLDSIHVDGKLTLGENIADLGGLNLSYYALQKAKAKKEMKTIDGFTPEQRFFMGYAQVWRQSIRDEALMDRIKNDPHSPGEARVNQTLFNLPEFYSAFPNIKAGAPLFIPEEDRAKIW